MSVIPDVSGLNSPDWLLAGFDLQQDRYHLVRVGRETYHQSSFLDHRIRPLPVETISLPGAGVDEVLQHVVTTQTAWIFHSGFCCSTLLASCLDHPGITLVLREPLVLSRLAQLAREKSPGHDPGVQLLMDRVIALCERSYSGERLLIKPSNFANLLSAQLFLPGANAKRPQHKAILMSCSLHALLISILKKKDEAETILPGFLRALLKDSDYLHRIDVPELQSMNLLQQAVLFWHCQRHFLQQQLATAVPGSLMTLSMERFLAQPQEVLLEVSEFLRLGLAPQALQQTVESGAFLRHSKQSDQSYNAASQRQEQEAIKARYADDVRQAMAWAEPLLDQLPIKSFDSFEEQ